MLNNSNLKRFLVVLMVFGLLFYSIYSFSAVEHRYQHRQPQEQQQQTSSGFIDILNTVMKGVEGLVDWKLRPITKGEELLQEELRVVKQRQQELESHVKQLELEQAKMTPELPPPPRLEFQPVAVRTTTINLKYWYDIWTESGLAIYPPTESSVVMNVGTNDIVSDTIINDGYWDIDKLRDIIVTLAKIPPSINYENSNTIPFVDIGANIGWFTLTVAGWGYRVESFEPMPLNNLLISQSLRDNPLEMAGRVKHHAVGLDFAPRDCAIFSSDNNINDGLATCESTKEKLEENLKNIPDGYHVRARLKTSTLDTELQNKDIYLMKIDVEGFEENVLAKGGAEKLFRDRKVFYIISEVWAVIDFNRYLKFFSDLDYTLTTDGFDGQPIPTNMTRDEFKEQYGDIVDVYMKKNLKSFAKTDREQTKK